ncbi:hypothetical protein [Rhodanobacter lindaniclasticus]
MTDSLAMMAQPALLAGITDSTDADVVAAFWQRHSGICDADRLGGDRIQNWMRHFESVGVIRTDSQSGQFIAVLNAALPREAIVDRRSYQSCGYPDRGGHKGICDRCVWQNEESDTSIKQAQ